MTTNPIDKIKEKLASIGHVTKTIKALNELLSGLHNETKELYTALPAHLRPLAERSISEGLGDSDAEAFWHSLHLEQTADIAKVFEPMFESIVPFKKGNQIAFGKFTLDKWRAVAADGTIMFEHGDWKEGVLKWFDDNGWKCQVKLCGRDNSHLLLTPEEQKLSDEIFKN